MQRWAPERIGVGSVPVHASGEDRGDPTAQPRLGPLSQAPLPNFSHRIIAIAEAEARDSDSLLGELAGIRADEEIEKLVLPVRQDTKISIPTSKVEVLSIATESGCGRFEDDPQILPKKAVVARTHGANL